jgi:hypothetical protein
MSGAGLDLYSLFGTNVGTKDDFGESLMTPYSVGADVDRVVISFVRYGNLFAVFCRGDAIGVSRFTVIGGIGSVGCAQTVPFVGGQDVVVVFSVQDGTGVTSIGCPVAILRL